MSRAAIVGVGLVSAGGLTLDETWRHILAGETSCSKLPGWFKLAEASPRVGHRIDCPPYDGRLVSLSCRAISQALAQCKQQSADVLCLGSTSASFSEVEREIDSRAPGYLARALGGVYSIPEQFQINQACSSSAYAIALGAELAKEGNSVLAGGADELTSCVMAAFEAARLHGVICRPFDKNRGTLTLGEAAAFVYLVEEDLIVPPLAYIDGIGLSCDARSSVGQHPQSMAKAIVQALEKQPIDTIDLVIAHGTGTKMNDRSEYVALESATEWLEIRMPKWVTSYKGSIGHPQGASGAVAVALAVKAIQEQTVFPTVGLIERDPLFAELSVPTRPEVDSVKRVLCLSYGSWGTNVALLISSPEVS